MEPIGLPGGVEGGGGVSAAGIVVAVLQSLMVAVIMALFNRAQAKRDKAETKRAEARQAESLLSLQLAMANGKLAYATAMAYKRGTPNGEMEDGLEAYQLAREEYLSFLNKQAVQQFN